MFSGDVAAFLADTGEEVSWTNSITGEIRTGLMLFDQADAENESSGGLSRDYEVTFETAAWPGLVRDELLVLASGTYKLRTNPRHVEDGEFCSVKLTKVK